MQTIEIEGLLKVPNNTYTDTNIVRAYKGRSIDLEKPIRAYRNLHQDCYSIKQGTLVVAHAERLYLCSAYFLVNEKNRQKVLETKQKNVHAFIQGFYKTEIDSEAFPIEVYYNPYKTSSFINKFNNKPIKGAMFVELNREGVTAYNTY